MMKQVLLTAISVICIGCFADGQIGVNTTTPDPNTVLDIKSNNKGILIPRTSTVTRLTISNTTKGLMIYDTTTNSFWYHDGSAWNEITITKNVWGLKGNSNTTAANFVGTTDQQPLLFRINNIPSGIIDSASFNTGIGYAVMGNNNGRYNTIMGAKAFQNNATGTVNVAMGYQALQANTTGGGSVAIGAQALLANTSGISNTAVGSGALYANTTGALNDAIGAGSLQSNTTGFGNNSMGYTALGSNNTGVFNTAIGTSALAFNQSGYSNIAIGTNALFQNVSGNNLIAIGDSAAFHQNASAPRNTAIGSKALYTNTVGYSNTAVGFNTLYNTNAENNTAIGDEALYANSSGTNNTAVGSFVMADNTSGSNNTAIGQLALFHNTTGGNNAAVGNAAMATISSGSSNTAIGTSALLHLASGSENTGVGFNTLTGLAHGSDNTAVGYMADIDADNFSYATVIGANADVNCSNCLALGGTTASGSQTYVGINNNSPFYSLDITEINGRGLCMRHPGDNSGTNTWEIYHAPSPYSTAPAQAADLTFWYNGNLRGGIDNTSGAYSALSDERMKQDIIPMFSVLDKIKLLRPSAYHYTTNTDREYLGFLAQDVEKIFPQLIHHINTEGKQTGIDDMLTMDYSGFGAIAVKAIQEQQQQIDELKAANAAQLKILQAQAVILEKLQHRIDRLEATGMHSYDTQHAGNPHSDCLSGS